MDRGRALADHHLPDYDGLVLRARDARRRSREIVAASLAVRAHAIAIMNRIVEHRRDRADAAVSRQRRERWW